MTTLFAITFFFSLSWANCLLTSVCFTVYFPWLQTMASFLHANSVANLSKLFCVFKIDLQSIVTGATLPGCHLKPRQLATPAPSLTPSPPQLPPTSRPSKAFWRTLLLTLLASGYAPTCSCLLSNPLSSSLEKCLQSAPAHRPSPLISISLPLPLRLRGLVMWTVESPVSSSCSIKWEGGTFIKESNNVI